MTHPERQKLLHYLQSLPEDRIEFLRHKSVMAFANYLEKLNIPMDGSQSSLLQNLWSKFETFPGRAEMILEFLEATEKDFVKISEQLGWIDRSSQFNQIKIKSIQIKNFRNISQKRIPIQPSFNLFIGNNATGKTSLLDAFSISLSLLLETITFQHHIKIKTKDIRRKIFINQGQPDLQENYPLDIQTQANIENRNIYWSQTFYNPTEIDKKYTQQPIGPQKDTSYKDLHWLSWHITEAVQAGQEIILPLFCYYGTQRLWINQPLPHPTSGPPTKLTRLDGYKDCLNPASTQEHFMRWMRHQAYAQAQSGVELPQPKGVAQAVVECIPDARRVYYDILHEELRIEWADGSLQDFGVLSDGYRNMLAMVADMAWRATMLNPHLGAEAPAKVGGVVLIDELDLHLHPKWQRIVVDSLRRVFPNVQFIATTHSPFIIQSLRDGELINLDEGTQPAPYEGKSPEDIAEFVQGVPMPQRSKRYQDMFEAAQRYFDLLERVPAASEEEVARLKAELDELTAPFSDNIAYHAFLERKRLSAEGQRPQAMPRGEPQG
jgi:predicted ATP-binding protein involved in virulence